ncbi:MAG: hypothetical protein ACK2UK_08015 [Candidatus Promineifilaceae bacterium]
MRSQEPFVQSFVIKIWFEETAVKDGSPVWRGSIKHVPGGEREIFDSLDAVVRFITSYLDLDRLRHQK